VTLFLPDDDVAAVTDWAAAGQLLATARQRSLGTPLPDTIKPVLK
jgi:hypothetical protein